MSDVATSLPIVFLALLTFFIPLATLRSRLAGRFLHLVADDAGIISCLTLLGGSIFTAPVCLMLLSLQVAWLQDLAARWPWVENLLRWLSFPGYDQPVFHLMLMAVFCFVISSLTDMAIIRWWVQGGRCPDLDATHPHSVMVRDGRVKKRNATIWTWVAICNLFSWGLVVTVVLPLVR